MIKHLSEALRLIDGRKDFVVKHDDGYSVVDYVISAPDTFDDGRHELRGLKFGPDGRVIARPLHKFFNVGERPETQPDAIDWTRPHVVTEKLDGSMIHPAPVGVHLRLMTRMGVTDVAERCRAVAPPGFATACEDVLEEGVTPIFEWTAPENRIVVGYDRSEMTLLAARRTLTGEYLPRSEIVYAAEAIGVRSPRVLASDAYGDWEGLARHCAGLEDAEGFVVWFDDGEAVKVKAPWYVTRHRALDGLRWEHDATALVLSSGVDDVLPLLSTLDANRLLSHERSVWSAIGSTGQRVSSFVRSREWPDRRTFAGAVGTRFGDQPIMRSLAFLVYDGADATDALTRMARDRCGNQKKCAELLAGIGASRW